MTNIYPDINQVQKFDERMQKLRLDNLMEKEKQIEVKLKHYKKLKRRWNIIKNIFHYGKYPIVVFQYLADATLILIPGTQVIGFVGLGLTTAELVGSNVLEDSLLNVKVKKYKKKCDVLKEYINKMFVFKLDAMKDGIISDHEMQLFKQLLDEYETKLTHASDSHGEANHTDTKKNGINMESVQAQIAQGIKEQMAHYTQLVNQMKEKKDGS